MDLEELASVNSEIRFLTIELMKIASNRNVPFEEVFDEFMQNAFLLKRGLKRAHSAASRSRQADAAAGKTSPSRTRQA
ncbi:MAG: hypothetical protein WC792_03425 [Candidatus Micrarchaeia archaeon]|jgi:hypothetical protein